MLYEGHNGGHHLQTGLSEQHISYRVRARFTGSPQTESFTRITDAKKWVAATETAIREGRYFPTLEAKRHTVGELIGRYEREILTLKPKNASNQRQQFAWWKTQLGELRLSDVTAADIVECRDRLLNTPARNGKDTY